jgi:hypothetical protein
MATLSRARTLVDLLDLGPLLKANARSRGLTVSEATRLAVASVLKTSAVQQHPGPKNDDRTVKVTIRLRSDVAASLFASAQDCGLSYGAYVTSLVHEKPAPPLVTVSALSASTERLARVSADLNELLRALKRDATSSRLVGDWVRPLLADVRRHVDVAAHLVSELRPARTRGRNLGEATGMAHP